MTKSLAVETVGLSKSYGQVRGHGVTVFMLSRTLTEVDRLANRIGIIHPGALIEEIEGGRPEELRSPRLEVEARDLEAHFLRLTGGTA